MNIDLAEIIFTLFWVFFVGLIFYLRREDKREGYPLESENSDRIRVEGFPATPSAKTFRLADGRVVRAPRDEEIDDRGLSATAAAAGLGAPLLPDGDPMLAGIGPGTYALRENEPDRMLDGKGQVLPLRATSEHWIHSNDADPRGMSVISADKREVGKVTDAWIDRANRRSTTWKLRSTVMRIPGPCCCQWRLLTSTRRAAWCTSRHCIHTSSRMCRHCKPLMRLRAWKKTGSARTLPAAFFTLMIRARKRLCE